VSQSSEFAAETLYVASQRVFIVVIYFVIDSVRKLLDTPSYSDTETKKHYLTYGGKNQVIQEIIWGAYQHRS
jgi:hypothetical protein